MLSNNLQKAIQNALLIAKKHTHKYATYEHLLLALLSDSDVKELFKHYKRDIKIISQKLNNYIQYELIDLKSDSNQKAKPTSGFQHVVQRAAVNSIASGYKYVTPLNVLAEFFLEHNSYALKCLKEGNISRHEISKNFDREANIAPPPVSSNRVFAKLASKIGFKKKLSQKTEEYFDIPTTESFYTNSTLGPESDSNGEENLEIFKTQDHIDSYSQKRQKTKTNIQKILATKSSLESYCLNLNKKAQMGNIDCLVGRQNEVQRTIEILSRRRKNNVLLVGEPGVGKTAIAEGLALRITQDDVPSILKKCTIYSLDIGNLVAGTKYRGDFEERIQSLLAEIKNKPEIILFIDEIHNIIGAGSTTSGALDASNLLKPALAQGDIKCIGSTTFKEYHNNFEKDMALVRRFQKIIVTEPTEQETIGILQKLKGYYEAHHKVKYEDSALNAAVMLSARYISDRHLPDKAIDLMDEAGARKKILNLPAKSKIITAKDMEQLVSSILNIPNLSIDSNDINQLEQLEDNLKSCIFGQDEVIHQLCASIKLSRAGLKKRSRPTGCYIFVGSTGVGKTELAKQLAKFCNMTLIKFDMSEYSESHSISKLIGSPPGYSGFDQGGLLTEEVDKYPYSVILLDEIEKAHPEILNILLQIMDEGTLTDSTGKQINFIHSIIILTTNLGSEITAKMPIGFLGNENSMLQSNLESIHHVFSPELRSRLDNIIIFNQLNPQMINMIIKKNLDELAKQLAEHRITFSISKSLNAYLAKSCFAHENGARILDRVIDTELKQKIADEMLFGKLKNGGKVSVQVSNKDKSLTFKFASHNQTKKANQVVLT